MFWHCMQIVFSGDNLHEMSKPVFVFEKLENYTKILSAEIFILSAKHKRIFE